MSRREPAARVTLAERWVLAVGWVLVLTALVAGIWALYTWLLSKFGPPSPL